MQSKIFQGIICSIFDKYGLQLTFKYFTMASYIVATGALGGMDRATVARHCCYRALWPPSVGNGWSALTEDTMTEKFGARAWIGNPVIKTNT